jgi:hypothetical protein
VSRVTLVCEFLSYAKSVLGDDLYSRQRKVIALLFHGSAIAFPVEMRAPCVSSGMTESRFKERLRGLVKRIGSRGA